MNDLTAFQRDLLRSVAVREESYGLGLKEHMEDEEDYGEVLHGRLYPNLDDLVDKGLISKGEIDKRTNSYSLTRRGRREINTRHDWINDRIGDAVDVEDLEK